MSQRLPSVFLDFSKTISNHFLRVSKGVVSDIGMQFQMASDLKLQEMAEKYPKAAASLRSPYLGFEMRIKFMNPYAKVSLAVPLIGIAAFNPLPGDFSVGVILISSSIPQIKKDCKILRGYFNGEHEKEILKTAREIANMLSEKSDPQKHLLLDAAPI